MDYLKQTYDWAKLQTPVFRIRVAAGLLLPGKNFILTSNVEKTHPFAKKYQKNQHAIHLHAETHCIVKFLQSGYNTRQLRKSIMYIARAIFDPETNKFRYGLCKPCIGCERALIDFGVKHVYFTTERGVEQLW